MRFTVRGALKGALLAAAVGLTACGGGEVEGGAAEAQGASSGATLQSQEKQQRRKASEELARAVALSLKDPAMRGLLRAAMAESLVKEEKVHLNTFLRGAGKALEGRLQEEAGLSEQRVTELLQQAGSLEVYFPVPEHRAAWKGGEELIVATALDDKDAPVGFNLKGGRIELSAEAPPAIATLAVVPAEDFSAEGKPSRRGLALGRAGAEARSSMELSTTAISYTGAFINYVNIPGDYEGWLMGDPEFEVYLERTAGERQRIRCAAAGSITPFAWNMNGETWTTPFLIAWANETPTLDGLSMSFYEDDNDECVIKIDTDYVKLLLDALRSASSTIRAAQQRQVGTAIISFIHTVVAVRAIIQGDDDYVGTVTSTATNPIDTTNRTFSIKNNNQQDKGIVQIQWRTRTY